MCIVETNMIHPSTFDNEWKLGTEIGTWSYQYQKLPNWLDSVLIGATKNRRNLFIFYYPIDNTLIGYNPYFLRSYMVSLVTWRWTSVSSVSVETRSTQHLMTQCYLKNIWWTATHSWLLKSVVAWTPTHSGLPTSTTYQYWKVTMSGVADNDNYNDTDADMITPVSMNQSHAWRNNNVIITSKLHRFDVIMTLS